MRIHEFVTGFRNCVAYSAMIAIVAVTLTFIVNGTTHALVVGIVGLSFIIPFYILMKICETIRDVNDMRRNEHNDFI